MRAYADNHIYPIHIPGCDGDVCLSDSVAKAPSEPHRTFDLINTNPIGPRNGETNDLADKNVSTLALEVLSAVSHVAVSPSSVDGRPPAFRLMTAKTKTKKPKTGRPKPDSDDPRVGPLVQVSRLR